MSKTLEIKILTQLKDKLSAPLQRLQSSSASAQSSFKALQQQLRQLHEQSRDIETFKKLDSSLQSTANKLTLAKEKVASLNKAVMSTISPSKTMVAELNLARQQVQKLTERHTQQNQKLSETKKRLEAVGISTKNLSFHEQELTSKINQSSDALKKHQDELKKTADIQQKFAHAKSKLAHTQQFASNMVITGAAGIATGRTMLKPLESVMSSFTDIEEAQTQLKVAMMGKDGEISSDYQAIVDLAIKLGDKLPGTTADFIRMMTMLRRQGVSSKAILGGLGQAAAHMGVLFNLSAEQAAEFAAKMQDALKAPETEMLNIADGAQRLYYLGVDTDNMLSGFASASPVLDTLKKTGEEAFKELAPLLAMTDQAYMDGAAAGNALQKTIKRSIGDISDVNAELKKEGIQLDFTDGKGEFGGLENFFKQLKKLDKLSSQKRNDVLSQIFGNDAQVSQLLTVMRSQGYEGYLAMSKKMEEQAALDERVNVQLKTLKNTLDAAGGSFSNAMAEIGSTAAEPLKKVINFFGELANKLATFVRENPVLVGHIVKFIAIIASVLVVLGSLGIALASVIGPFALLRFSLRYLGIAGASGIGIFGKLINVFGTLKTALFALGRIFLSVAKNVLMLGRVLLTNPIVLILTAIAGAAYLIWQNWDYLKAKAIEIWNGLTQLVSDAWNGICQIISDIGSAIVSIFMDIWNSIVGFFSDIWNNLTTAASGGVEGIGALIVNWSPLGLFYQAFSGVLSWFGVDLPTNLTGAMSTILSSVGDLVSSWNISDTFQNIFSGITNFFGDHISKFTEYGSNLVGGLVNGVKSMAGKAKDAIMDVGSSVVKWFKEKLDINSPSRVFMGLGGFVSEGLADGIENSAGVAVKASKALATGTLAGAVALSTMPLANAAPIRFDHRAPLSVNANARGPSNLAGDTITIHVHASSGQNAHDIARLVKQEIERLQAQKQAHARSSYRDYGV